MGENNNTEVSENELSSFDDAWDNDVSEAASEEPAEVEEAETGDAADSTVDQRETNADNTEEPQSTENSEAKEQGESGDQTFTLKHLGKESTVGREEVIVLAQKGMDYDRQKGKYEALNQSITELGGVESLTDHEEFLKELAASGGVSVEELIDSSRANILAKRENIDPSIARGRIDLQKQEKALSVRESKLKEKTQADEIQSKRDADFLAFAKAYPDVKAMDIPKEVWSEVAKGTSLIDAYGRHEAAQLKIENQRLRSELETARQNNENRQKAAGSQKTAGSKNTASDPFDEGWDD